MDEDFNVFEVCVFCLAEMPHEPTAICIEDESLVEEAVKELRDPISTGRKRAANALPTGAMGTCEWAYLKRAGGGPIPIVGCIGNAATDRHHGPDKSTLNNERPGEGTSPNLWSICSSCHNWWHAQNDRFYGDGTAKSRPADNSTWLPKDGVEWFPHDAETKATQEELIVMAKRRLEAKGIK